MGIQKKINGLLLEEQKRREQRKGSGKIAPSSLGRCFRFQIWNRQGVPKTNLPDARALRVFKVGDLFHKFIQGFYPDAQLEVRIETDDILGYADIVLEDTVIDIKSQHSRAFWYMQKENYNISKEKTGNIMQVVLYAMLLKKPFGELLFVSKDDLCVEEVQFKVSDYKNLVEKELATLRSFWKEADKTIPPPKPRAYGGKECKYCAYLNLCKKEIENEKRDKK